MTASDSADDGIDDSVEAKRPRVVVIGSANTDMVARVARLPNPGETLLTSDYTMVAGGKGANQAVAAARLGAVVTFIACVGADTFGDEAVHDFEAEGIDTRYIVRDPDAPTGTALITVSDETGDNTIIVAPGANSKLSPALVDRAVGAIYEADVVVCQLEVPLETILAALKTAHTAGKITVLNPAPARVLTDELLSYVSVLTPNETEAAFLTAEKPARAASLLRWRGAGSVVVTLGAAGAHVVSASGDAWVPTFAPKEVVDTTAAGDCFTGALAVALGEGQALTDAVRFANAAASLSVETEGAQPSLPNRLAVNRRIQESNLGH